MLGTVAYAATQARIRARLSRLISAGLWNRLVATPDLKAFISELQYSTYAKELNGDPKGLERAFSGRLAREAHSLAYFLQGNAREVVVWYARRFEVANLKTVLRALNYQLSKERALAVLLPLEFSTLPWEVLLEASSIVALIERLRPTAYARPLEGALERYQQEGLLYYLEVSLDLFYFQRLVRLIEYLTGEDRRQAERFLGSWLAVQNLLWAARYRLYARMKPEEIVSYTLHRAFAAGLESVRRIALGIPLWQEAGRLGFDLNPELPESAALIELEKLAARALYQQAQTTFGRTIFHLGSVLAYLFLLEGEVADLMTLLEGKIASLTPEELRGQLLREV